MTLTLSISAGLPVFYQVAWGDGTVTKLQENGTILKGQCHEKKLWRFIIWGLALSLNTDLRTESFHKKCTYSIQSCTHYTVGMGGGGTCTPFVWREGALVHHLYGG